MVVAWPFTGHVNWIKAMSLYSSCVGCASINLLTIVFVPYCPSPWLQCKVFCESFGISKNGLGIRDSSKLYIVLWELKLNNWRVKDDCICIFSGDYEAEMLLSIVNFIVGYIKGEWKVSFFVLREYPSLRDLKPFVIGIIYFESELIVGESLKVKYKLFDDFAFRFNIVILATWISKR